MYWFRFTTVRSGTTQQFVPIELLLSNILAHALQGTLSLLLSSFYQIGGRYDLHFHLYWDLCGWDFMHEVLVDTKKKPWHGSRDYLQKTLKYTNYWHLQPLRRQQQKRLISNTDLVGKTTVLRVTNFSEQIFTSSLHEFLIKLPNLTLPRGCKHLTMT